MPTSDITVWAVVAVILAAVLYRHVAKRLARQKEWNTDRRAAERRSELRRERERRRMARPPETDAAQSERRRANDRRTDERRNPDAWEESYKSLVKSVDEEGYPSDF